MPTSFFQQVVPETSGESDSCIVVVVETKPKGSRIFAVLSIDRRPKAT